MFAPRPALARVFFACLASLAAFAAQAQRSLDFEPYAVPREGAVAVTVSRDSAASAAFVEVDAIADGALSRAVANAGFLGDRGTLLNLHGVGPYTQVIVIGTGTDAPSPRLLEDIGGLVG